MATSGLISLPARISSSFVCTRKTSFIQGKAAYFPYDGKLRWRRNLIFTSDRKHSSYLSRRYPLHQNLKVSMDASFGSMGDDTNDIFPRINVRDPYKRLGISREASYEEIQAARNFLVNRYAGHKPSIDAIESAHDKIMLQSLAESRRPKINVGKKIREIKQSRLVKTITSRFQSPSRVVMIKTTVAFIVLGVLTVLFPTEEGPTLQVAISLLATMYFIYARLRSRIRAFLYGSGTFLFSWLLGTFLMVSVIPPLLQGPRNLEVSTSLLSYILLWISSTYLK